MPSITSDHAIPEPIPELPGGEPLGSGRLTDDPVREALAQVWARPEFTRQEPGLVERGLARVREALGDLWRWIVEQFPDLSGLGGTVGTFVEYLLWAILLAVLLGMGWLLARSLARRRGAPGPTGRAGAAGADRGMDPATWDARAREAAEAGRLREAALARYRALLLRLARSELLRLGSGRTPGDYLAQLRGASPELAGAFRGFVTHLHPLAFGPAPPSAAAWEALLVAAAQVEGRIPTAARGAR